MMKKINKWSVAETSLIKSLLAAGKTKKEIAERLGRSQASINDKIYRVNAEKLERHGLAWTKEEDQTLYKNGIRMTNDKFAAIYPRGAKEINQRYHDLKNGKVMPGQNLSRTNNSKPEKSNNIETVQLKKIKPQKIKVAKLPKRKLTAHELATLPDDQLTTRQVNKRRGIPKHIYFTKAAFRKEVEKLNRETKCIPEGKYATVSSYQYQLMNGYFGHITRSKNINMGGRHGVFIEAKNVEIAFAKMIAIHYEDKKRKK